MLYPHFIKTAAMCVQFILQGIDKAWHCNLCSSLDRHCHFNRLRLSLYSSGPDPVSGSRYISLADSSVNFSSIFSLSKNILWRAIPSWPRIRWPNQTSLSLLSLILWNKLETLQIKWEHCDFCAARVCYYYCHSYY